ncbi:MAG: leucine--tRNA ligase [Candidatus Pacebacteria bacterium]|nr:leucine--tRNA ligase [Candidatus Paceibacterota bacterium]
MKYDFKKIEGKWQKEWEKAQIYKAKDFSNKKKYFALVEFPYPSADGLHVGHVESYTAMDIVARKRRMEGYNVLFPMGWDAFGLPAENYAIKTNIHPAKTTRINAKNYEKQMRSLGFSFDWSRLVDTTDPDYYKWTQQLFLRFFEKGLAYRAKANVNWCLSCKTALANEEVVNGRCERCGGEVTQREKEQWMLKITNYADKLLAGLKDLDFLQEIKTSQINWIGKSEGALLDFSISNSDFKVKVFTTRPDTIFGATYLVLAPEHVLISNLKNQISNFGEIEEYVLRTSKKTEEDRLKSDKDKTGVELRGVFAINPATKENIPIFISDYVLANYGTGAIMAVPAHDERDFKFANKFNLQIKKVVEFKDARIFGSLKSFKESFISEVKKKWNFRDLNNKEDIFEIVSNEVKDIFELAKNNFNDHSAVLWSDGDVKQILFHSDSGENKIFDWSDGELAKNARNYGLMLGIKQEFMGWGNILEPYLEDGKLINSGEFTDLLSSEKRWEIAYSLNGRKEIKYKLRDWVFSRQRYWGEPIPLAYCDVCSANVKSFGIDPKKNWSEGEKLNPGWVAIPEKNLPVVLPSLKKFKPGEDGESPLAEAKNWIWIKCPKCGGKARRETDTMPNWAGSSWYFLAYALGGSLAYKKKGSFWNKKKLDYWLPVDWYNGGMEHVTLHLLYSRFWNNFLFDEKLVSNPEPFQKRTAQGLILGKGGVKMSKSKGNVVNPDVVSSEFGADALRLYEMFMGPFNQAKVWEVSGILGPYRFLERVWNFGTEMVSSGVSDDKELSVLVNATIKKVSDDVEKMAFNTAVSSMMILINSFYEKKELSVNLWKKFLLILAPFAPHITEELWQKTSIKKSKKIKFIHQEAWPEYDEKLVGDKTVEIVIQVNGKIRGTISVDIGVSEEKLKKQVLDLEGVKKAIDGKEIKKVIFIKDRLINFVI